MENKKETKLELKTKNGIQSDHRVDEFGEVFTPDSIVNKMIDLVDERFRGIEPEEYILKTYFEPACGDGQFLVRILDRKLRAIKELGQDNIEVNILKAVSSIYGIDIQADNISKVKERMFELITSGHVETFDIGDEQPIDFCKLEVDLTDKTKDLIHKILDWNIQCGNALTCKKYKVVKNKVTKKDRAIPTEDKVPPTSDPNKYEICISEYTFDNNGFSRTKYYLSNLDVKCGRKSHIAYTDGAETFEEQDIFMF